MAAGKRKHKVKPAACDLAGIAFADITSRIAITASVTDKESCALIAVIGCG
jgi:hypothetical protein